jgi:non-ribosomal peptide synthetase component F
VLLTERRLTLELPELKIQTVFLDDAKPLLAGRSRVNPIMPVTSGNLAYVIYTSGSTGRPKGVGIEHRSATTFLQWAREVSASEDLAGVLASYTVVWAGRFGVMSVRYDLRWAHVRSIADVDVGLVV